MSGARCQVGTNPENRTPRTCRPKAAGRLLRRRRTPPKADRRRIQFLRRRRTEPVARSPVPVPCCPLPVACSLLPSPPDSRITIHELHPPRPGRGRARSVPHQCPISPPSVPHQYPISPPSGPVQGPFRAGFGGGKGDGREYNSEPVRMLRKTEPRRRGEIHRREPAFGGQAPRTRFRRAGSENAEKSLLRGRGTGNGVAEASRPTDGRSGPPALRITPPKADRLTTHDSRIATPSSLRTMH